MDKPGRGNRCLGYVVRKNKLDADSLQCWLIHGEAIMAQAYPDEVKMVELKDDSLMTYFKDYCDCRVRYIHFRRHENATNLQISYHRLKQLQSQQKHKKANNITNGSIEEAIQQLQSDIANGESEEVQRSRLNTLEGLYDWLPLRLPHRKRKGSEQVLPTKMVKWLLGVERFGRQKALKYWEGPVRIRHIFKKPDFSAFLYQCLDKRTGEEAWYLATQNDPLAWVSGRFAAFSNTSMNELANLLPNSKATMLQIFFQMECIGTKIAKNNEISYESQGQTVTATVDPNLFPARPSTDITPSGCFSNFNKAQEKEEMQAISEVGRCPVEELTSEGIRENGTIGFKTLLKSDATLMEKIGAVQKMVEHQRLLKLGLGAAKMFTRVRGFMNGKDKDKASVKQLHEYNQQQLQAMVSRLKVLLEGLSHMFLVISAVSNTNDQHLKMVCSKELLDHIFSIGGLAPKLAQNLAMRPDMIADDFVRNKLKETQNNNPTKSEKETLQYLEDKGPMIELPHYNDPIPLLSVLEYVKPLSAGSVGQVDLFKVRETIPDDLRAAFMALLPAGSKGTVVVKSVFEDTKEEYESDWSLLELFFTQLQSKLDAKLKVVWKVLEPLKTSIFDEFDLRKEAQFTMRGKAMLEEFTANIGKGLYNDTLPDASLKLTTPNAIATSSPFVMIQSLAAGVPLKNHLETSSGQLERLIEWKDQLYSAILMVYGHMVLKHGFFQSDPHNGNWFWDADSRTITLIDWGGVGELQKNTHCRLANLYNSMGNLQSAWDDCESVIVSGFLGFGGTYVKSGISIFDAGPEEPALFMGKTYQMSYKNKENGLQLWYSGDSWVISRENLGAQELLSKVAEFKTPQSKIGELTKLGVQEWTDELNKKFSVTVSKKRCKSKGISRKEAYGLAANFMGIGMKLTCPAEKVVTFPEGPLTPSAAANWKDNGKVSVRCIHSTEDRDFIKWGLHDPLQLTVSTDADGTRYIILPVDGGRRHNLDDASTSIPRATIWSEEAFTTESRSEMQKLSPTKRTMVLTTAESGLAAATSLYDSDLVTAAEKGLDARDMIGLLSIEVPDEYVLLGRCILVFHGMLGDVVKDSFMRLVSQPYLQWMLQSNGARFFKSWTTPAREYLAEGECQDARWRAISS